jgi:hypothetical protein
VGGRIYSMNDLIVVLAPSASILKDFSKQYPNLEEEYKDRKSLLYYAIDILEKVNEIESNQAFEK